jgi:hypothetical protein
MTNARNLSLLGVLSLGWTLLGCGAPDETPGGAAAEKEQLIHRTVVHMNDDGTTTSRDFEITMAEHQEDIALRTLLARGEYTPAVTRDNSCVSSSMWLFDQPNLAGREICFFQSPRARAFHFANLSGYIRYVILDFNGNSQFFTWGQAVRSFWGGIDTAGFWPAPFEGGDPDCGPYAPFARRDSVGACVSNATSLGLRCAECSN